MSREGIVYFIQPVILVGTNRYKIGCASNMSSIVSYHSGTRVIEVIKCKDYFTIENEIIKRFKEKFITCGGKEYFQGNEEEMKKEFCEIVSKFTTTNTIETDIKTSDENIVYEKNDISKSSCKSKYSCIKCNYSCNKKQHFEIHLLTKKHKTPEKTEQEEIEKYGISCNICNKKYKSYSGLWNHKQKCKEIKNTEQLEETNQSEELKEIKLLQKEIKELKNIVMSLVKNNIKNVP